MTSTPIDDPTLCMDRQPEPVSRLDRDARSGARTAAILGAATYGLFLGPLLDRLL